MSLIEDLFRSFMFFFDKIIYGFIPTVYQLLIYLSQIDIFSTDTGIGQLMSQIYALLGIFMLFKVSFSILQYLIDPNAFSDSSKGFGKILKNTLVAIILLVMVPFIFSFAAKIQYVVVNSNILGNLILGSSSGSTSVVEIDITDINNFNVTDFSQTRETVEESAKDLQFLMYGAFFSINTNVIKECDGTPIFGSIEMAQNYDCLSKIEEEASKVNEITSNNVNLNRFFKIDNDKDSSTEDDTVDARDFGSFGYLLSWRIDNEYVINYLPVISAATGIYIMFLLITFCIDIAVRAIKLCFLQMIAPISIVSYIDPKENMGNSKLRNWINECLKTYISLFIRLAVIFFVIRLVSIIASGVFSDSGFVRKLNADEYTIWIYVFLVLGAFMFAKQVPKMIETLFGWKGSGELNLNPIKSITSNAAASGLIGGAIGLAGGLAANSANLGFNTYKNIKKEGLGNALVGRSAADFKTAQGFKGKAGVIGAGIGNLFKGGITGVSSVVGGGVSGAVQSGYAARSGKIPEGIKTGHDKVVTNREERKARQKQTVGTRAMNAFTGFAGTKNEYGGVGEADKQIKDLRERRQRIQQYQENLAGRMEDYATHHGMSYINDFEQIDDSIFDYKAFKEKINNPSLTETQFEAMSHLDRYKQVSSTPNALDKYNPSDVQGMMALKQEDYNSRVRDKEYEKQIKDLQKASGLKEDKK